MPHAKGFRVLLLGLTALATVLGACDKKARNRSSAGVTEEAPDEGSRWKPSVYNFVSVDQSLADARKAAAEERWADAAAAAAALLKQSDSAEGRRLLEQAKLEGPNQVRMNELAKAAGRKDTRTTMRIF